MQPGRARRFAAGAALLLPLTAGAQRAPLPADVRAACDNAVAILAKTQGLKTRRSTGAFTDETFRAPITGCRIEIDGSFKRAAKSGAAAENLREGLEKTGWTELADFSADGHDGTSFAFRKAGVACFARGSWDGGSDDEPEVPAADPYKVTVICGSAAQFERPR
jgi:hypothetical protein